MGTPRLAPDAAELGVELRPDFVEALVQPLDVGALDFEVSRPGLARPVRICLGQPHLLARPFEPEQIRVPAGAPPRVRVTALGAKRSRRAISQLPGKNRETECVNFR